MLDVLIAMIIIILVFVIINLIVINKIIKPLKQENRRLSEELENEKR